MREERRKNFSAKIQPSIAVEFRRANRTAISYFLAVIPGADDQENFVVAGVLGLDRFVDGQRSVDGFLIPEYVHQHHRNFQRQRGEDFVPRLLLTEGVVSWVLDDLVV